MCLLRISGILYIFAEYTIPKHTYIMKLNYFAPASEVIKFSLSAILCESIENIEFQDYIDGDNNY